MTKIVLELDHQEVMTMLACIAMMAGDPVLDLERKIRAARDAIGTAHSDAHRAPAPMVTLPVRVNGKRLAVVATTSAYAPAFRRPDNAYSVFVTGNCLNSRKSWHATAEAADAAAVQLAARVDGAFFPTWDGDAPWL